MITKRNTERVLSILKNQSHDGATEGELLRASRLEKHELMAVLTYLISFKEVEKVNAWLTRRSDLKDSAIVYLTADRVATLRYEKENVTKEE